MGSPHCSFLFPPKPQSSDRIAATSQMFGFTSKLFVPPASEMSQPTDNPATYGATGTTEPNDRNTRTSASPRSTPTPPSMTPPPATTPTPSPESSPSTTLTPLANSRRALLDRPPALSAREFYWSYTIGGMKRNHGR